MTYICTVVKVVLATMYSSKGRIKYVASQRHIPAQ